MVRARKASGRGFCFVAKAGNYPSNLGAKSERALWGAFGFWLLHVVTAFDFGKSEGGGGIRLFETVSDFSEQKLKPKLFQTCPIYIYI